MYAEAMVFENIFSDLVSGTFKLHTSPTHSPLPPQQCSINKEHNWTQGIKGYTLKGNRMNDTWITVYHVPEDGEQSVCSIQHQFTAYIL